MESKLKALLEIAKSLPEDKLGVAIDKLSEIKQESGKGKPREIPVCPKCGGKPIVRNGHQSGKQQYLCKGCGRSFVETSDSAVSRSHASKTVWKQVIADTINGVSIDETAELLDLHHETVFNMRHKILYCLEQAERRQPQRFSGICEADETINTVNGYHSFIKERNRNARGFATKYLNRYNSLFGAKFRATEPLDDDLYNLMSAMNTGFASTRSTQTTGLLVL
jgi:transposase-like protein